MKLVAGIPVDRVEESAAFYSYRHEVFECEVVRVLRTQATQYKHLNRWHYFADVVAPAGALAEAMDKSLTHEGRQLYRINIFRNSKHKGWKPPEFPKDSRVVYIESATPPSGEGRE